MASNSAIEWTDATWNPWHGCHKVSQGCKNCYMFRDKARYGQDPNVVVRSKTKFYDPLKWKEPRTIFTCSWSDFFIEEADPWRDEAFAIMALTPQHTYQVLTKRPDRMLEYFKDGPWPWIRLVDIDDDATGEQIRAANFVYQWAHRHEGEGPLSNVWLGVSVEDQKTANERIPLLIQTPAAKRWLSIEPLLGPLNLAAMPVAEGVWWNALTGRYQIDDGREVVDKGLPVRDNPLEWAVAGGESGPDARPMHPDWVRQVRDDCIAAGVPFFFKQWGEWLPVEPDWCSDAPNDREWVGKGLIKMGSKGQTAQPGNNFEWLKKVGKKKAGRILDGRTWDEMPEVPR